jgi:flagellar assembly protein FliH
MKGELQSHWEQSAVKVATRIAERIIRREVVSNPQITLDNIAEALRLATGTAEVTVHIHPMDHENLGSQVTRLAETLCQLAPSSVVADADVSPGGCRVVTRFGEIDQRIESQLRRIEEELQ